jgi:hypothetical protein
MSKMSINDRIALGEEAGRMLAEASMFNGIVNSIVKEQIVALMGSTPGSEAGIQAHAILSALEKIKGSIKAIQNDGAMARKDAEKG